MTEDPAAEPGLPIEWYQAELRACRREIKALAALLVEGRELVEAQAARIAELETIIDGVGVE